MEEKMSQVLLFDTAIATSNNGDEIIFRSALDGLQPILYNSMSFRLGTHIGNYSFWQMLIKNWKAEVLCDKADFKFVCGTNLLAKRQLGRFPQWAINPFNARLYKDCIMVGVGRRREFSRVDWYTQKLYRSTISKQYKHSVRDEATKTLMESMGFQAINTGCPTLWGFNAEKCARIPKSKADSVILTVSGHGHLRDLKRDKYMVEKIRKNYSKIYAWIQTTEDLPYLRELTRTDDIDLIYSLDRYEDILSNENVDYVGTRLHGGIFALQHERRAIIVSIDQRARGFYESNNIPIIERNNIRNLEDMINSEIITDIKVNHEAINEFLSQFVPM